MSDIFTRRVLPPEGTNLLTDRLIAQGIDPGDSSTWPENVWCVDGKHFLYKFDWIYTPTWEAPCGLMAHKHGDSWGDTFVKGVYHCAENDNPLFRCPIPWKKCPHRLALPAGINCEFHRTDKPFDQNKSIDRLEKEHIEQLYVRRETEILAHPNYDGVCMNRKETMMPDGKMGYLYRWNLSNCLGCRNTCCPARGWRERDTRPANIFFDVYIERVSVDELVPITTKRIVKNIQVFDKAIARTDAEFALAIWKQDPDNHTLPSQMRRINSGRGLERNEDFFIVHHGQYGGKRYKIITEIQNVRVEKSAKKDLLADLQAARDGVEVVHESDAKKAQEQEKRQRRHDAKIEKAAKAYANAVERGVRMGGFWSLQGLKADQEEDAKALAEAILQKRRKQREAEELKNAQISFFDG